MYWLFGRSGAGKTTLATLLADHLRIHGVIPVVLDGDIARKGLCKDLPFSKEGRNENHRRLAEVAHIILLQGISVVVASMAPEASQRSIVTSILGEHLKWIYVDAPLDVCVQRDPKGLYRREIAGMVQGLTRYPFEEPSPTEYACRLMTATSDPSLCLKTLVKRIGLDSNA